MDAKSSGDGERKAGGDWPLDMLPREKRLTDSRAFGQVFRYGRGVGDSILVLKYRRLTTDEIKAGVSVSRKLGNACVRNRVKRRIREALRDFMPRIRPGHHLVVVAKTDAPPESYAALHASLGGLLDRARLLC